jgi:hypothetical protein
MLRALVIALLVANLAFYGWSQGWFDALTGVRARGDREPERLAAQVEPDSVVVLSALGAGVVGAPACLEAGPFSDAPAAAAEAALQGAVPNAGWTDVRSEKPGAWLVYMGSYPDRETLLRKEEEIRRVRAEFEEVAVPTEGDFGLSLGRFDDRGAAERALLQAQQRGIRTARVVQLYPASTTHRLRIERAEPAVAAQLAALKSEALGKGFAACERSEAPR